MAHFYGVLEGNRGAASRCATKGSGLSATAAGWSGAIVTHITHDSETGEDLYQVWLTPWQSSGGQSRLLHSGKLDATQADKVLS